MMHSGVVSGTFGGKPFQLRQTVAAGVAFWDVHFEGQTYPVGPVFRDDTDESLRQRVIALLQSKVPPLRA